MQRQRGELVPIADALADLPGPVKAIREDPPPAQRGFTVADQVNQLVRRPAKRTPIGASWRGRWRCAPCPAPTPATGTKSMSDRNGPYTLW